MDQSSKAKRQKTEGWRNWDSYDVEAWTGMMGKEHNSDGNRITMEAWPYLPIMTKVTNVSDIKDALAVDCSFMWGTICGIVGNKPTMVAKHCHESNICKICKATLETMESRGVNCGPKANVAFVHQTSDRLKSLQKAYQKVVNEEVEDFDQADGEDEDEAKESKAVLPPIPKD